MTLLGIDPLAEGTFRDYSGAGLGSRRLLAGFLAAEPAALLSAATAARLGVRLDDALEVRSGTRTTQLIVRGIITPSSDLEAAGLENLLVVDIATAQEALGLQGRLSRIDLKLDTPPMLGLPPGLRVERSASRTETAAELTRAFRINLQALSLLALLCGAFLIYNSVTFSVVLRRKLFATLRALGTTRGAFLRLVFAEVIVVGLVGSLLGVGLGIVLARGLIGMVSQTVTDL